MKLCRKKFRFIGTLTVKKSNHKIRSRDLLFTLMCYAFMCSGNLRSYWEQQIHVVTGSIIGDEDRKSWDARGPMIWDNFSIFRTNCAILTSYIHARVVVSRVDVVTLRDQLLRIARFSCGFFTAMAGNKEPGKIFVLLCS